MKMNVIFMRHTQAQHNVTDIINSNPQKQVILTELGRRQAVAIAKKLGRMSFDVIYVSEFVRTQETANIINKGRFPIIVDKRINEFNVGLDGKKASEWEEKKMKVARNKRFDFKLKGGESMRDLKKRVEDFLDESGEKDYRDVLVVTHGDVVNVALVIFGEFTEEEATEYKVKNGEYFGFEL